MSVISLSFHIASQGAFSIQLGERTTFEEVLPKLHPFTQPAQPIHPVLTTIVVAHTILPLTVSLHELGIRSGDHLLILSTETSQTNFTFGEGAMVGVLCVFLPTAGETLLVSDDEPLTAVLPHMIRHFPTLSGYVLERLRVASGRSLIDTRRRLSDADLKRGDILALVTHALPTASSRLRLLSSRDLHPPIMVTTSPSVIGRYDRGASTPLDIDLSTILPSNRVVQIAHRQVIVSEQSGLWQVRLHPDARIPAFVDNRRLSVDYAVTLHENNVLSFGFSPNRPAAQFIVELSSV
ncbi:MAG: hypothetical protein OHK0023_09590 [Anaerolineae bacterium]